MPKTIRINDETYETLERLSEGFETPNETIVRIAHDFEYQQIFKILDTIIENKIKIIEEEGLEGREGTYACHYDYHILKEVIENIASANSNYRITYSIAPMGISFNVYKDE